MEAERSVTNGRNAYYTSPWILLQLSSLGVISYKENNEKSPELVALLHNNEDSDIDDVEKNNTLSHDDTTPFLDDTYRLQRQHFGLWPTRRRLLFILSSIAMFVSVAATVYLFVNTMLNYFGDTKKIIHFISMTTLSLNLLLLPVGCSISRLYFHFVRTKTAKAKDCCSIAWCLWMFLEEPFVVRRLRFLPLSAKNKLFPVSSFLVVSFIVWIIAGYLTFVVYYRLVPQCSNRSESIFHGIACLIGEIYFCLFCNYVFMLRKSLREELLFLIKYCYCNEGNIQSCRRRIVSMVRDYRVIRTVTNLWMQIVLPASVLGLVVHIKWNYLVFTKDREKTDDIEPMDYESLVMLSIYIFVSKLMVTGLPVLALGGTDLQYLWNEMRLTLSLIQQFHAEGFWKETLKFVHKLNPHGTEEWVASVALSVIGVYLGLKVGTQDIDYKCT